MPIPKSKDVGKTIGFLKEEKPGMPHKQKLAIALDVARRAGADIPRPDKGFYHNVVTEVPAPNIE